MPPKIPEGKRREIADEIRAGKARNAIAREFAVGLGTVSLIARENGLAFDRAATEDATRARAADMKAERTQLAADLMVDARRLRERAWSEYRYYERGPDGPVLVTLDLPPLGEVRNAYAALGIGVDKHLALVKHDAEDGSESGKSMLGALAAGLGAAYEHLQSQPE